MAIMTPSRHMEIPMLVTVRMVRRRFRQQFLRTSGRYRNIAAPFTTVPSYHGRGRDALNWRRTGSLADKRLDCRDGWRFPCHHIRTARCEIRRFIGERREATGEPRGYRNKTTLPIPLRLS